MEQAVNASLKKQIQGSTRKIQRVFFEIVDDIRSSDQDNFNDLVLLLKDETLARKFQIFQENRAKNIRKKILDCTGDLTRELEDAINNYSFTEKETIHYEGRMRTHENNL